MSSHAPKMGRARRRALVPLLGALTALAPATVDAYLPALPAIQRELPGTGSIPAQATLAASLLGLAIGQLAAGVLSDRLGRRRPLLLSLLAYTLASLTCAAAPSAIVLVAGRVIAGMTGAAAVAIARAIAIEQTADERESAKLLSRLMVVAGIAPIAAPLIGGSLVHLAGWRAIFLALAAAGAVIWTTTLIVVPPAGSPRSARPRPRVTTVLGDPRFARYSLALACASVALFTYIAASPSLLETDYRLSPAAFAAIFAANAAGLLATTLLNTMALTRLGPRRLSAAAFAIQLPASLAFAIAANQHAPLIVLAPIMFVQIAPLGVLLPNTAALALDSHRPSAGTASALLGFTQFAIGAAVSPLGAHPATATLLAVPAAATGLALVGIPTPPGWPSEPRFFGRDPKTSSHQGGLVGFEESLKGHRSAV